MFSYIVEDRSLGTRGQQASFLLRLGEELVPGFFPAPQVDGSPWNTLAVETAP
jgi:hypothetical protein